MAAEALRMSVSTRSGRIRVEGRAGAQFEVRGGTLHTDPDGSLRVHASHHGSHSVEVVCPAGTGVLVGTASGAVELAGDLGDVRVTTRSGRITIERARSIDIRSASGAIDIGDCAGKCRIVTRSSKVHVGKAAELDVAAMSGRVTVDDVANAVVRTMSGKVGLSTRNDGRVEVRTMSGAVEVTVPEGRRPATHLHSRSGRVHCECENGGDGEIAVATTSGTIHVTCK
jgi:DUF4097 and DUF4098 domain-containing protein YvlB